jgi:hypothetical protein
MNRKMSMPMVSAMALAAALPSAAFARGDADVRLIPMERFGTQTRLSPDAPATLEVAAMDGGAEHWSVRLGGEVLPGRVSTVAFAPDSRTLVVSGLTPRRRLRGLRADHARQNRFGCPG